MGEDLRETLSLDELFAGLETSGQPTAPQRPFKLLDPYGPEDREIFFGREDETEQILLRFYRGRLLLVYGESGSGKSSLIQCGLRSSIPSVDMQFFNVRSAMNPIESLRKEILKQVDFRDREIPESDLELIREAVFLKSKPLALIFDQFEELFLFQPPAVRERLAAELANWLENEKNLRIIICIRSEHFSHLGEFEPFLPDIYSNKFWVRRMSRDQVYEVITGPCRKFGVAVEKELTRELVDRFTSGGEDANLPILQVVLEKLYRMAITGSQQRPSLTMAGYIELGRIETILSRMIEEIIEAHDFPDLVLQVFKAMVGIDGTKRISSGTEIMSNASEFGIPLIEDDAESILEYLIANRTVRQDADSNLYELSHDVLTAPVYAMLTVPDRNIVKVKNTIENRYKDYTDMGTLLDDATLNYIAPYEERLFLSEPIVGFIEKSRGQQLAVQRRKRMSIAGAAGLALLSVIVALISYSYQKSELAAQNLKHAEESEIRLRQANHNLGLAFNQRADSAISDKSNRNYNAARVLSLQALSNLSSSEAAEQRAVAVGNILGNPDIPMKFLLPHTFHHQGPVNSVAFSPDGQALASGSSDYTVGLWDTKTGNLKMTLKGHTDRVAAVAFSPCGRWAASASADNTVALWELQTGNMERLFKLERAVRSVAFSPDSRIIAAASSDGKIAVWKTEGEDEPLARENVNEEISTVLFSPQGETLLCGTKSGEVHLWDLDAPGDLRKLKLVRNESTRFGQASQRPAVAAFSPATGSRKLAVASGSQLRLHDLDTGAVRKLAEKIEIASLAYHPGGRILAAASKDCIRFWDVDTGQETAVLKGHTSAVRAVSFSMPDGRMLASASADNSIRLWCAGKNGEWESLSASRGHTANIRSVAVSRDGSLLASASEDNTIRLWDMGSGREIKVLREPAGPVAVAFSRNRAALFSGAKDGTVCLWDTNTGRREVLTPAQKLTEAMDLCVSPDGKTLVSAHWGRDVVFWDIEKRRERPVSGKGTRFGQHAHFSPDGKTLALGSLEGWLRLLDLRTNACTVLQKSANRILTVAFSNHNPKLLACGTAENVIYLYDLSQSDSHKFKLQGHTDSVKAVKFSPDDRMLASASMDHTIRLWDVSSGELISQIKGHTGSITTLAFTPDARHLATAGSDNSIRVWDLGAENAQKIFKYAAPVKALLFLPNSETLLAGTDETNGGNLHMLDVRNGKPLPFERQQGRGVLNLCCFPEKETLFSGAGDRSIHVWNLRAAREHRIFNVNETAVSAMTSLSPTRTLALGCDDGSILLFSPETGRLEELPRRHSGKVLALSVSPDGRTLASGSADRTVRIWDLEEKREIASDFRHTGPVWTVGFSPGGRVLASGSSDKTVCLWNLETRQKQGSLAGHAGAVKSVGFSPDGRLLASGSSDCTVRLWEVDTGEKKAVLKGHRGIVYQVAFSPRDGNTLLSGSHDRTVRVWDLSYLSVKTPIEDQIRDAGMKYRLELVSTEVQPLPAVPGLFTSSSIPEDLSEN